MSCCDDRVDLVIPSSALVDPDLVPLTSIIRSEDPGLPRPSLTAVLVAEHATATLRIEGIPALIEQVKHDVRVGLISELVDRSAVVDVRSRAISVANEHLPSLAPNASLSAQLAAADVDERQIKSQVLASVLTDLARLASDGLLAVGQLRGVDLEAVIDHAFAAGEPPALEAGGLADITFDIEIQPNAPETNVATRFVLDPPIALAQRASHRLSTYWNSKVEVKCTAGSVAAENVKQLYAGQTKTVALVANLDVLGLAAASYYRVYVDSVLVIS